MSYSAWSRKESDMTERQHSRYSMPRVHLGHSEAGYLSAELSIQSSRFCPGTLGQGVYGS